MKGASVPQHVNILIASPLESDLVDRIRAFDPARVRVIYEPDLLPVPQYDGDHDGTRPNLTPDQVARWRSHLAETHVLFDFDWLEPDNLKENAPDLMWVQATSSGIGEFLARLGLLGERDVIFTTAAGVHSTALAEFVALAALYFTKKIPTILEWQRHHYWQRHTTGLLMGTTALIVGLGHVGRAVARTLNALGVDVWAIARTPRDEPPQGVTRLVSRQGFPDLLADVGLLVLACPYTDETHHLIGRDELSALSPSSVLVNVARGPVVDESALVKALANGEISGAALDVFEEEPLPADHPFWDMSNVLISPHSASTVSGENSRIVDLFLHNLGRFLEGKSLINSFDHDRTY